MNPKTLTETMILTTIHCPCGEVTLELLGDPFVCLYCHCDDCQTVHGGAYLPAAMWRIENTRMVAGEPGRWARKTTIRAFCRTCGTRLYAEPAGLPIRSIVAGLLPASMFRPTFHMQCQYAVLPVRDELPHYREFPPLLGGSDDRVEW